MKNVIRQLAVSIVVLVAGTILGVVVEKSLSESEKRVRYLDYEKSVRSDVLSTPAIPGKRLEVTLDGKRIDDLSRVTVRVWNFSDQDFEKVPVYIEMYPKSDNELSVISRRVVGANEVAEAVSTLDRVEAPSLPGGVRYGYEVASINRTDRFDPAFKATYLLLGRESPEVTIQTTKKGLRLREVDFSRALTESWLELLLLIGIVIVLTIAYVAGLALMVRFSRRKMLKADDELGQRLWSELSPEESYANYNLSREADVKGLIEHFIKTFQRFRWEKIPKFMRRASAIPEPDSEWSLSTQ